MENVLSVIYCAALSIENGRVKCTGSPLPDGGYPVDTTVHFECDRGNDLSGSASSTCETSGLWSQPTPTCNQGNTNKIFRGVASNQCMLNTEDKIETFTKSSIFPSVYNSENVNKKSLN